jgi:hypothetical protein
VYSMVVSRVDRLTEVKSRRVMHWIYFLTFYCRYSTYCLLYRSIPPRYPLYHIRDILQTREDKDDDFRIGDLPLGGTGNSKR